MKRVSRFNPNDWYVFCDICGKRCHASETTKLHTDTGRGGLIVCRRDADRADLGLVPKNVRKERPVPFSKRDPNNTSNDYPVYDLESNIVGDLSHYTYIASSQGDIVAIEASQGILIHIDPRPGTERPEQLGDLIHISTSQGCNELIVPSQSEDVVIVASQEK